MCPFAQKAWIALEASNTPYQLEEISLYGAGGKPDWFWDLNPKGTVPVLVSGGGAMVLPDSDLILDQFEKGFAASKNLCPDEKADEIKEWRKMINDMLPVGKNAVLGGSKGKLDEQLKAMDAKVEGPYLTGVSITTADCHAFPFLWRLNTEFGLKGYQKLNAWVDKCSKEDCFKKTIQSAWWWWW